MIEAVLFIPIALFVIFILAIYIALEFAWKLPFWLSFLIVTALSIFWAYIYIFLKDAYA
tara:strand:- start:1011 stop:1187 length:177 start_codon:yes stop_codon:yes gene_type:complete